MNFEIPSVIQTRARDQHRLWVRFSDGVEGTVDLSAQIPDRFAALRDAEEFARVQLIGGGVGWENGFDCAPEWLRTHAELSRTDAGANDDGSPGLGQHAGRMPEISRFFGIVIRMFYTDHARPHFHAEYANHTIAIEIAGDGIRGSFPPSRIPMLFEWRDAHRDELLANWNRLQRGEEPLPISPLA
jgi:hypothetical protein